MSDLMGALQAARGDGEISLERKAQRTLALQVIDAGYKALAQHLHPDRGGSPNAMRRLNGVRPDLKQLIEWSLAWTP